MKNHAVLCLDLQQVQALKENRAIADYVKNLGVAYRALSSMTERKTQNDRTK